MIADLYRLYETYDPESYLFSLEEKLEESAQKLRMALILPVHFSELHEGMALNKIISEISKVRCLDQILIAPEGTEK